MHKKKKFDLNLEIFRDIFQICPRVHGQNFNELPTHEDIVSFFKEFGHTEEIKTITDIVIDQMHQPWRTFATIINRSLSGKTTEDFTYQIDNKGHKKQDKMYYPQFTKVIIHHFLTKDKTISKRNRIGMHTSRDDYLINTLRFFFAKEESQIYGARLPKSLTSPEMSESKTYKTYLGYAIRATPPKKEQKFKKHTSPQLTTVPVSPEEPIRKSKRVKRPTKKEILVKSLSKKKEKMTVQKCKGIDSLSKVALTEEAQYKEGKDEDDSNNEHDSRSEGSDKKETMVMTRPNLTVKKGQIPSMKLMRMNQVSNLIEKKMKNMLNIMKRKRMTNLLKPPSNSIDNEEETNVEDKVEIDTDNGFIQKKGTKAEMITVEQGNENPESSQVIEDVHESKFLNFSDIPYTDAEIVSPIDVHVHHEVPIFQFDNNVTKLEKEVAELKKNDPLNTRVTALVDEHLDSRLRAIKDEFMSYLLASITARITEQVKNQLPHILPKEVSNFAPLVIQNMVSKSLEHAVLAKESSQPKFTYEASSSLTEFELKKIFIDKMDENQSYLIAPEHGECYDGLIKSYNLDKSLFSTYDKVYSLKRSRTYKDKDENPFAGSDRGLKKRKTSKDSEKPEFEVVDSYTPKDQEKNPSNNDEEPKGKNDGNTPQQGPTQSWLMTLVSFIDKPLKTFDELMSIPIDFSAYIMNGLKISNLTQETLLGPSFKLLKGTRSNYAELEHEFEECYKALSKKLDWNNPEGGEYPFDLTKCLPLVMKGIFK
uniref:Uncharacterized protein n=1 Tax=Tanacetum cinerariifolium TaxID=118510 RepID=A0A6L2LHR5_TANCI|nr:hypothetical protein [Tanacetum cinerariifolium]